MSSSSNPFDFVFTNTLLVRDVDGQYRPAGAEEVLQRARQVDVGSAGRGLGAAQAGQ
jgi:DNA repair protein RadC